MRVILCCAGTGGHIYPALAIAEALKQRYNAKIHFIGSRDRMEAKIVPQKGYKYSAIDVAGFNRTLSPRFLGKNLVNLGKLAMFKPLRETRKVFSQVNPDFVIGTGGFVCGPVILRAWLDKLPSMILETNLSPGFTNKLLGRLATFICVAFEQSKAYFPKNKAIMVTGAPVRAQFLQQLDKESIYDDLGLCAQKKTLLILGGSQGSKAINDLVPACAVIFDHNQEVASKMQWIHITGQRYFDDFRVPQLRNLHYQALGYVDDIHRLMMISDLAIARAGASTVSELAVLGVPALLIPWSKAANNHQFHNAKALADAGAALMLEENELNKPRLAKAISESLLDDERLGAMAKAMKSLGAPDAAVKIAKTVAGYLESKRCRGKEEVKRKS